jgi:hypothetical protein
MCRLTMKSAGVRWLAPSVPPGCLLLAARWTEVKSVVHERPKGPRCLSLRMHRSYLTNTISLFSSAGIPSVADTMVFYTMQRHTGCTMVVRPNMLEHLFDFARDVREILRSDIVRIQ